MSAPFSLMLSIILFADRLFYTKIVGVVLVVAGVGLISTEDKGSGSGTNPILGDVMALLSGFIFACSTTLMKYWVKDDGAISMFLFLGLLGGCNVLFLWPLFFGLNYTGIEHFEVPDWNIVGLLTLTGSINILSDYFWARSILLTSPLIANVGLCFVIPLSLLADRLLNHIHQSPMYIVGACCVAVGFIMVNLKRGQSLNEDNEIKRPLRLEDGE